MLFVKCRLALKELSHETAEMKLAKALQEQSLLNAADTVSNREATHVSSRGLT